jgi:DNA-binding transcriptional LysR family regulator
MELRHLRYFVAVAEALSFTKAAENLRLAQPSLTRQIKDLEAEIGGRLFDRSGKRISLTQEGGSFLPDARRLLAECAQSVQAVLDKKQRYGCALNGREIKARSLSRKKEFVMRSGYKVLSFVQ